MRRYLVHLLLFLIGVQGFALTPAIGQSGSGDVLSALRESVVAVRSRAVEDARSNTTLGRERLGSGVVIDEQGHILTIGYLVIEAEEVDIRVSSGATYPARVVGYDHATGFAVLRPLLPIALKPLVIGSSEKLAQQELMVVLPFEGLGPGSATQLVSRRPFAGSWEYLLDSAIYTFPPNAAWAGAALLNQRGELVGLGSLYIRDAIAEGMFSPGNIFVPIDLLEPIQRDLVTKGVRSSGLNPWMGITPDDSNGYVAILRVSKDGPADQAGLRAGDFITAVAGKEVRTLRDLYRTAWGLGSAGTRIPIEVERDGRKFPLVIKSIDRTTFFKKPDGL